MTIEILHAQTLAPICPAGIYLAFTTGEFLNVWILWAILAQVFGLRHPPPLDDLTPLDRKRRLIGYARIAIFFLILTPLPFS